MTKTLSPLELFMRQDLVCFCGERPAMRTIVYLPLVSSDLNIRLKMEPRVVCEKHYEATIAA